MQTFDTPSATLDCLAVLRASAVRKRKIISSEDIDSSTEYLLNQLEVISSKSWLSFNEFNTLYIIISSLSSSTYLSFSINLISIYEKLSNSNHLNNIKLYKLIIDGLIIYNKSNKSYKLNSNLNFSSNFQSSKKQKLNILSNNSNLNTNINLNSQINLQNLNSFSINNYLIPFSPKKFTFSNNNNNLNNNLKRNSNSNLNNNLNNNRKRMKFTSTNSSISKNISSYSKIAKRILCKLWKKSSILKNRILIQKLMKSFVENNNSNKQILSTISSIIEISRNSINQQKIIFESIIQFFNSTISKLYISSDRKLLRFMITRLLTLYIPSKKRICNNNSKNINEHCLWNSIYHSQTQREILSHQFELIKTLLIPLTQTLPFHTGTINSLPNNNHNNSNNSNSSSSRPVSLSFFETCLVFIHDISPFFDSSVLESIIEWLTLTSSSISPICKKQVIEIISVLEKGVIASKSKKRKAQEIISNSLSTITTTTTNTNTSTTTITNTSTSNNITKIPSNSLTVNMDDAFIETMSLNFMH